MRKSENDFILNIAKNSIDKTRNGTGENTFVDIEINMFMNDKNICKNSLREYSKYIAIHSSKEKDPRMIPMEAMRYLLFNAGEADYYIYMEDDLVINDTSFLDKINWFYNQTDHKFILMPHRYERTVANSPKKLYVDGPIRVQDIIELMKHTRRNSSKWYHDGEESNLCRGIKPSFRYVDIFKHTKRCFERKLASK